VAPGFFVLRIRLLRETVEINRPIGITPVSSQNRIEIPSKSAFRSDDEQVYQAHLVICCHRALENVGVEALFRFLCTG
jgi:hypothetical protein